MQPSLTPLLKQFSAVRFWPIWLLVSGMRLLSWLPLPFLYCFGAGCGECAYWLHHGRRKITIRNLSACFPDKRSAEIRALARSHFRALAGAVFIIAVGWWGSKNRLNRLTRFRNREIFDEAIKRGDNIIFLVPHFVGLEHGGAYMSVLAPTINMYQRHKNPLMEALIKQHRARFGALQVARTGLSKSVIQLIRSGRPFYYLPDQDPGNNKSVFAPFYSIPTATFASLGPIARLCKATVIPCMTRILPWGRGYEIIFDQPLFNYSSDKKDSRSTKHESESEKENNEIREATEMNQAIEELIAHAPAQYLWSHRRFKTRPADAPPFY